MMGYKTVFEIASEWNVSERTVRNMCQSGKIKEASKIGGVWIIPSDVKRPLDKRETSGKYKNWRKRKDERDNL